MAIKKIKLPGMAQPVDIGTTWANVSDKPDLITSEEATAYMQKGIDYVTAGQKAETTLGAMATAEGYNTTASGGASHAEGNQTTASGNYSHAEGYRTTVDGDYSHAEGYNTTASGSSSHAEGSYTTASGKYSHAEGNNAIANHRSQHVFGEYNIADDSTAIATNRGNYVEIVGNGTASNASSNARTLDWSGNEVLAGKLTVGANPTANMDVATKQYVDNNFIAATSKGANNGVAQLDAYGRVPTAQLPSYVDDVIEGTMSSTGIFTPRGNSEVANPDPMPSGESGKIYVDINTNKTYRWGGSQWVEISESLALGETSSTAYAGDKGKEAHDLASAALPKTGGAMSGDIAMGNHKITNLADGEVITDAATVGQLISLIQHQTATIGTSATSAVINLGSAYTCINAYATIGNERVGVDIEVNEASGIVTFSTAQEPPSAITCHVFYFLSVLPTTTTIPDPSGGEIIIGN